MICAYLFCLKVLNLKVTESVQGQLNWWIVQKLSYEFSCNCVNCFLLDTMYQRRNMPKSNNIATALSSSSVKAITLVIVLLIQVNHEETHEKASTTEVTDQGSNNVDNKVGISFTRDILLGKIIVEEWRPPYVINIFFLLNTEVIYLYLVILSFILN